MSRLLITLFLSFVFMVSSAFSAEVPETVKAKAPHTRVTYPTAVSIEVLGRGLMYAVYFDQVLNDDMAAGFGYGGVSTENPVNGSDGPESAKMIPAYFNYYFSREAGSLFGTAGMNVVLNASKVKGFDSTTGGIRFPRDSVIPTFGLGYENRTDTGMLFRIAGYGIAGRNLKPWLGFSFGYAF